MRAAAAPAAARATQMAKVARMRPAPIPPLLPASRTADERDGGADRSGESAER